jgi:hypothetical protein
MRQTLKDFLNNTSGAVTVDWVVLTAAVVGLGMATATVVSGGVENLVGDIRDVLGEDVASLSRFELNRMANASFEDIEAMIEAGWGFYNADGSVAGWLNASDSRAEVHWSGYQGVTATDGDWMMDLDASPGNIMIGQQISSAVNGQTYTLTFDAADPRNNNGVNVYWGGQLVESFNPTGSTMQTYSVEVVGGDGDGENMLFIGGTGPQDNQGAYIDNVNLSS